VGGAEVRSRSSLAEEEGGGGGAVVVVVGVGGGGVSTHLWLESLIEMIMFFNILLWDPMLEAKNRTCRRKEKETSC